MEKGCAEASDDKIIMSFSIRLPEKVACIHNLLNIIYIQPSSLPASKISATRRQPGTRLLIKKKMTNFTTKIRLHPRGIYYVSSYSKREVVLGVSLMNV